MARQRNGSNGRRTAVEKERVDFKALLAVNPNYFGTYPGHRQKAVARIKENTKYEEIRWIGFYPELDQLEVLIDVKLPCGYNGSLCKAGSYEYVRFFIDWDGDGEYRNPGEDVGIVSVNVHDIPEIEGACPDNAKPLSYALGLKISFQRKPCKMPRLVKVRAILSWENPPPEGDPDFPVIWGNVIEKWVQIRPARYRIKDILSHYDLHKLKFNAAMLELDAPVSKPVRLTGSELANLYRKEDVPLHRYHYQAIKDIVHAIRRYPARISEYQRDPQFKAVAEAVATLLKAKPSTRYEELRCVGLNYDQEQLAAVLTVKMPSGYNGDLCAEGSTEYVAFWLRVHDESEMGCTWKYMGTASVNVHDVKPVPVGGLQYAVYLPVDLSALKQLGSTPKVLKVRAVLSWNGKPDPADPEQLPVWGNRVEALIQLKPRQAVKPGECKPFIWSVGTMAVENIAGNSYTLLTSTLGDGYANGVSLGGGFMAMESPFGGMIAISGKITHPPANPAPADKLKYKVQYKKVGSTWKDIMDDFRIWLRINGVPGGYLDQSADDNGYFRYQVDDTLSSAPPMVEVQDNILAIWHTPVADGDGLYLLRVLLHSPGALPRPGVPAEHLASGEVKVMIDNTPPLASIALDEEPCRRFIIGGSITGEFTAWDKHIWHYSIAVLPNSVASPPTVFPASGQYPVLAAPGSAKTTFTLTTGRETTPCGYILRLWVKDRAIVNNRFPGNRTPADVGFCLLANED
ncbi:MAG: hypothetical protein ACYDBT_07345 [Desulfobulbaceae bacterium]